MTDKAAGPDGSVLSEGLGPLPEYGAAFTPRWPSDEGGFTAQQVLLYARQAVAAERERCAQYLRDKAERLAPHGRRTNQVDRHCARVLATAADELALAPNVMVSGCAAVRCT